MGTASLYKTLLSAPTRLEPPRETSPTLYGNSYDDKVLWMLFLLYSNYIAFFSVCVSCWTRQEKVSLGRSIDGRFCRWRVCHKIPLPAVVTSTDVSCWYKCTKDQ